MSSTEKQQWHHGVMEAVMGHIDRYVDSLAPEIQPRIQKELEIFQQKTIDSLEEKVVAAFRALFNMDKNDDAHGAGRLDAAPPAAYGGTALPFADEIAKVTRSFGKVADEATGDVRDIFDITEKRQATSPAGGGGGGGRNLGNGARGFLSAAVNAVQDHLNGEGSEGKKFQLDGLLGVLSNTVKEAAGNPEEKARLVSPEIKDKVAAKLREMHAPIAEEFTHIALDHIKRWLRGNVDAHDLGDSVKGELHDHVKDIVKGISGLLGKKDHEEETARGVDAVRGGGEVGAGGGGGFSRIISDKLSTGIARVHREVRLEFRTVLGVVEKKLFELLPDEFRQPLEKILGGNPFDAQLDREATGRARETSRALEEELQAKLVGKIRSLVLKMQDTLRESVLGVVNGGHRLLERESWTFVQTMVEAKVQRYLPQVKITVPDDIGNEGVSVGPPAAAVQLLGGRHQPGLPT